jgi:hypothetical protein
MNRFALAGLVVILAALASAMPASASGPAAPGKQILAINCEGLGSITVSVPRGENSNGAGQILGATGHGIPTSFAETVTDVTTGTELFSDSFGVGNGHAHTNQATIACSFVEFEATAAEIFGSDLPPGVALTDIIRGEATVDVVLKP